MAKRTDYPFDIRQLSAEEGGSFLILYPDFLVCASDGDTVGHALANGNATLKATISALKTKALVVPAPNSGGVVSGKFVARVPKSVHARLAARVKADGMALNTQVLTLRAEGLGRKAQRV